MPTTTYTPLRAALPEGVWPEGLASFDAAIDKIALLDAEIVGDAESWGAFASIEVVDEAMISLPFIEGTGLVIGSGALVSTIFGRGFTWRAQVGTGGAASLFRWRFARDLLLPARMASGSTPSAPLYEPNPDESEHVEIGLPAGVTVDSDGNFTLVWPGTPSKLTLEPCYLGQTGILVEVQDAEARFSADTPIPPEYANLHLGTSFRGVFVPKASVRFPKDLGDFGLDLTHAAIGSGGFSGNVIADINEDVKLFDGFDCTLKTADVSFVRNSITKFELTGTLKVPFFDRDVDVKIGLATNGDFVLALATLNPVSLEGDFIAAEVAALGITRRAGKVFLTLSGSIRPKFFAPELRWPTIEVESLVIGSDGSIDLGGSWIDMPKRSALNFYGFGLEFGRIGFGSGDSSVSSGSSNWKWIGFDGTIRFADGIAIGGSVKGLQIAWDPTSPGTLPKLSLSGIAIDLVIPNALELHGTVSFTDVGGLKQFSGGGRIKLPSLNCELDCQIKIAKSGSDTALYVSVDAQLPVGIPIASTGLSLYGMGGLYGQNLKPDRASGEPWFDGWYKRAPEGVTSAEKWIFAPMHQVFGASATIGTAGDDGFAFSTKLIAAILFPGPVMLLEGRARLASKRSATGDPPFKALAVYDGNASTLEANVEARWKYPPVGPADVIKIKGTAEAFFDMNRAERWHVYLGERIPDSKRIRADILKLFKADGYVMLSQPSIEVGASVGINKKYDFGPLNARLKAYFECNASLDYRPIQVEAEAGLHGRVALKAFGFGMGVSIDAAADVKTPTPKEFSAEIHAEADFPRFLPDPEATIRFSHEKPGAVTLPLPLESLAIVSLKASESWHSGAAYDASNPVVPLDGKPVLAFSKAMQDVAGVAGNIQTAPKSELLGSDISYKLLDVELSKRSASGSWTVVRARPEQSGIPVVNGMWVPVAGQDDAPPCTTLMLFVTSPFDTIPGVLTPAFFDQFADLFPSYPSVLRCIDFEHFARGPLPAIPAAIEITTPNGSRCRCYWIQTLPNIRDGLPHVRDPRVEEPSPTAYSWRQRQSLHTAGVRTTFVSLPTPAAWVRVRISSARSFTVTPIHGTQTIFETAPDGVSVVRQASPGYPGTPKALTGDGTVTDHEIVLKNEGNGITMISIIGVADLFEVCHVDVNQPGAGLPGDTSWNAAEIDRIVDEEFLLEPDTSYKLTVKTRVEVSPSLSGAQLEGSVALGSSAEQTSEHYFRTLGPPGFVGDNLDRTPRSADATSALRLLDRYVKATTPANGQTQVYRAYDVSVDFAESYVDRMYASANASLAVRMFDQNGETISVTTSGTTAPIVGASTALAVISGTAKKAAVPEPRPSQLLWLNMLSSSTDPVAVSLANLPKNDILSLTRGKAGSPTYPLLKPGLRYEAAVTAVGPSGTKLTKLLDESLYTFAFTTSYYASFAHHIHSFDGTLWNVNQGRDAPLAPLSATQRKAVRVAARVPAPSSYATIALGFGIEPARPPARLELTLLNAGDRNYGFLLDSPEPIAADRLTAIAKWAAAATGAEAHQKSVCIADAVFGIRPGSDWNSEWIDVVALENVDLSGLILEQVVIGVTGETLIPLHIFASTGMLESGTIVRLHAGAEPSPPVDDPRINHIYRAGANASSWLFSNSGDLVRLRSGTAELSRRGVLPASAYAPVAVHWIWNADRTRAFVMPDDGLDEQPMVGGTYRFEFAYALDLGSVIPAAQIQSYHGSSTPESAAIQVVVL